jgi:hypothetical protein
MRREINEYSEHAVSTKKLKTTLIRLGFFIFQLIFDHAYWILDRPVHKIHVYEGSDR